jgi:hypothetical protein
MRQTVRAKADRQSCAALVSQDEALAAGQERCPNITFRRNPAQGAVALLCQERHGAKGDGWGNKPAVGDRLAALAGAVLNFAFTGVKRI